VVEGRWFCGDGGNDVEGALRNASDAADVMRLDDVVRVCDASP